MAPSSQGTWRCQETKARATLRTSKKLGFHLYFMQHASLADPRWYKRAPPCHIGKLVRRSDHSGKPISCTHSEGNEGPCVYGEAEVGPWDVHGAQILTQVHLGQAYKPRCPRGWGAYVPGKGKWHLWAVPHFGISKGQSHIFHQRSSKDFDACGAPYIEGQKDLHRCSPFRPTPRHSGDSAPAALNNHTEVPQPHGALRQSRMRRFCP